MQLDISEIKMNIDENNNNASQYKKNKKYTSSYRESK
jgi:hypothetical protein